jgi:hypothetical protein
MSLLDSIGGLIQQYASSTGAAAAPAGDVADHYAQVAQAAPQSSIAAGLASALSSGGSSGFGQMAAQLFSNSGGTQQANMLNGLLATAGPAVLNQFLGANAGSALSGLLGGGQTQVTPDQAAAIPPEEVQALAEHVHNAVPGVAGEIGQIYAAHPQIVQTLGAAAMAMAVRKIAEMHS